MPTTTDLPRLVRLSDVDVQPDALGTPAQGTGGTVSSTVNPNPISGSTVFFAYSLRMKTRNAQNNFTGTGTQNVYAGETLISAATGNPTIGALKTFRYTMAVGTEGDAVRIYKAGTNIAGSYFSYQDIDLTRDASGNVLGGTVVTSPTPQFGIGTLSGFGGTSLIWDDPNPALGGTSGGTTPGVNFAHANCVLLLQSAIYDPVPFLKRDVPKQLASGMRSAYKKGYVFQTNLRVIANGTSDEQDVATVLGYPYVRFWPRPDTAPATYFDCSTDGGASRLMAQFFGAPKEPLIELAGMDVFPQPQIMFGTA